MAYSLSGQRGPKTNSPFSFVNVCDTGSRSFLPSFPHFISINFTTASSIGSLYTFFIVPNITFLLSLGKVISMSNCLPSAITPSISITGQCGSGLKLYSLFSRLCTVA